MKPILIDISAILNTGKFIIFKFINETAVEQINFGVNLTEVVQAKIDFGSIVTA